MKIIVLSRALFNEYLTRKGVTLDNVEQQEKIFFISIHNQEDTVPPFFASDKSNVINLTFSDLEEDKELPVIGENRTELFKAMTSEQASALYKFIKANKDKEAVLIHCTAGVARSGAVGVFINDFMGGDYLEFKRNNPHIQPNPHVYNLLRKEWINDVTRLNIVTGEPMTDGSLTKPFITDEMGQMPVAEYKGRGIQRGENEFVGMRFTHPDGSSTFVAGVDPHRTEEEFEQFWLETDKYYGMVNEAEIEIIKHLHPSNDEFFVAKKKILPSGEFEAFAEFGIGDEYTGIDLGTWLRLKNMLSFFNTQS